MTTDPTVFISYSHDSDEVRDQVRDLAERLVRSGIEDCRLDQWVIPDEPWHSWMDRQLDEADYVIVVCTPGYRAKAKNQSQGETGRGVRFESLITFQELYNDHMRSRRFVPVTLGELAQDQILRPLQGFPRYRVDSETGFEDLLRHLFDRPRFVKPKPGNAPTLPVSDPVDQQRLTTRRHNLPSTPTISIGREDEVEEVCRLLGTRRLVTLLGPAGCGKTHLGLKVAHRSLDDFVDGVWWVQLAPVDEELVPQAIGEALGLIEQAVTPPTEILADYLRDKTVLLVLDNCEHVVEECARVIEELLAYCPEVKVFATSRRQILRGGDEYCYDLEPLSIPSTERIRDPEKLLESESARLFCELGQTLRSTFTITSDNAPAIARICRTLDGIPLALELAAARLEQLSAEQIATHLDDALKLLGRGRRTRHRTTLTATLDWSHDLLEPEQQYLFARMSIFNGGCSIDQVVAVCTDDDQDLLDILDDLERLIGHSLLQVYEQDGRKRYLFLEVIRQYARQKLQSMDEYESRKQRHRDYFLELARAEKPKLLTARQRESLECLERDHGNLRAAVEWSSRTRDVAHALELGAALWRFWEIRGYLNEGRQRLGRLLQLPSTEHPELYAEVVSGAGLLAYRQGDHPEARKHFETALAMERKLDREQQIANALNDVGIVASAEGDYETGLDHYRESLEIKCRVDDDREMGVAHYNIGSCLLNLDEIESARRELEISLARFRAAHNLWETGFPLLKLGYCSLFESDWDEALRRFEDSREARRARSDKRGMGDALDGIALTNLWRGRSKAALEPLREAFELHCEVGDERGKLRSAETLAELLTAEAEGSLATRLFGHAAQLRKTLCYHSEPQFVRRIDQSLDRLRQELEDEAFNAAWNEDRSGSMDDLEDRFWRVTQNR